MPWTVEAWTEFFRDCCGIVPERASFIAGKFQGADEQVLLKISQQSKSDPTLTLALLKEMGFLPIDVVRFISILREREVKEPKAAVTTESPRKKRRVHDSLKEVDDCIPHQLISASENPEYVGWYKEALKYSYYLIRDGDEENSRRCVTPIHPLYCVTYAHGNNGDLRARDQFQGKTIQGDRLNVFSTANGKKVEVEVVVKERQRDFIILQSTGVLFFDGSSAELSSHILAEPKVGLQIMAMGYSTKEANAIVGNILSIEPDSRQRMLTTIISWGGDSGAPLFSILDPFREDFNPREALTSLACPFDICPSTSFDRFEVELAADEPEIVRALVRLEDEEFTELSSSTTNRLSVSKRARLKRLAEICAEGKTPTVAKPKKKVKKKVRQITAEGGNRAFLCASGSAFSRLEMWMRKTERVNIKLRGQSSLSTANVANRLLQGVIVAFDKHWNLLLSDVDEVYTPAVRLKKVQASARAMPPEVVYEATTQGCHYLLQRRLKCSLVTGSSVICIYKPDEV